MFLVGVFCCKEEQVCVRVSWHACNCEPSWQFGTFYRKKMNASGEINRCLFECVCVYECTWNQVIGRNQVKPGNRRMCSHCQNFTYSWSVIRFLCSVVFFNWYRHTIQFLLLSLSIRNNLPVSCSDLFIVALFLGRFRIFILWIKEQFQHSSFLSSHCIAFPVLRFCSPFPLWHAHL